MEISYQKEFGVAILIPDKIELRSKKIMRQRILDIDSKE